MSLLHYHNLIVIVSFDPHHPLSLSLVTILAITDDSFIQLNCQRLNREELSTKIVTTLSSYISFLKHASIEMC